jgi:DnaK suppressor protein
MAPVRFSREALDSWRKQLEAQAAQLREAIAFDRHQLDGRADMLPPAFDDGRDEPANDALRDVDVAELARRATMLSEVEAALARVADGTFGTCAACGEDIGQMRLQATPHSSRCLACQAATERGRTEIASL